jgi:hypothetical protein
MGRSSWRDNGEMVPGTPVNVPTLLPVAESHAFTPELQAGLAIGSIDSSEVQRLFVGALPA